VTEKVDESEDERSDHDGGSETGSVGRRSDAGLYEGGILNCGTSAAFCNILGFLDLDVEVLPAIVSDMKDDRKVICSERSGADFTVSSVEDPILSAKEIRDEELSVVFSGTLCGKADEIHARTSENWWSTGSSSSSCRSCVEVAEISETSEVDLLRLLAEE
jgi:hypothetical protein